MTKQRFANDGEIEFELDASEPSVVDVRCPFCAGRYTAGFLLGGQGVVYHSLPYCRKFAALDPIEFLEAARAAGAALLS